MKIGMEKPGEKIIVPCTIFSFTNEQEPENKNEITDEEFFGNFLKSINQYRSLYGEFPESVECDVKSYIRLALEAQKRNDRFFIEKSAKGALKICGVEIIAVQEIKYQVGKP